MFTHHHPHFFVLAETQLPPFASLKDQEEIEFVVTISLR